MADTVDSLSIELTASTESAENSIQRVIDMLRMLKAATIDASAESRIVKSIRSIAKAAKEVDSDAGQKLARLAGGLNALSKVGDLSNLADAGKNLSSVVRAVNSMGQSGGKGLSGLANGIKQTNDALGGIKDADVSKLGAVHDALSGEMSGSLHSSTRASESAALGGMGTPEPSFGNMAAYGAMTVFKYTADSIRDATVAYREFCAALADGGSTVDTQFTDSMMTVFKYTADSIRDATTAYREFQAVLGSGVPPIFTEFADSATQAGESVRMLTGSVGGGKEGPWVADEIRDAARAYDDVGNSASRAADVIETEFVNPFANFKMKPLEDELPRVTLNPIDGSVADSVNNAAGAFGNLSNVLGGLSGELGPVASGLIAIPKYFGGQLIGNIQKATKGLTGFFHSIVRIAKYRLIRSALRMITQGINQGMKNLYAFSQVASGTFAASMDRIATASQYLGNSFAAMASPLVEALAPAIDFVVDKVVAMFNTISQIIARLTGKSTYTAAKKVAATWSGAAKSAGKGASDSAKEAVDEIKRTIMGFDEINKLNEFADNASGGGSGGGGGGGGGAGAMFEELPIDSEISNFADALKEAFLAGDWQELGTLLGTKVNELVDSIDWAGAGATVGYYINGWFSTKYWTLDTINFTNIGSKIAEFLNSAINEIDFNILGRLMVQKLTIIGDLVIGFFETFDWGQAAEKFSNFVSGIFDELAKWLEKTDWAKLGESIVNNLVDAITSFDYTDVANSIAEFLGSLLGAGIKLITGLGKAIGEKIGEAFNGIGQFFNEQIEACGGDIVGGILRGIIVGLTNIGVWIVENIFQPFINGFKAAFGIASPAKTMEEPGKNIVLGIFQGIINALKNVGQWVKDNIFDPIWGAIKDAGATAINITVSLVKKVGEWAEDAWEAVKSGAETIVKTVQAIFTEVGTWAGNVWNAVKAGAETIVKEVKAIFSEVGTWAGNVWDAVKAGAETIIKEVKAIFTEVGEWAGNVWTAIKNGAETIVKTVKAIFTEVGTWAGNVWDAVKAGAETIVKEVKAIFSEVGTWAGNVWDTVKAGTETIIKTVTAGMQVLSSWVSAIVDFILGPDAAQKNASIAMTIENVALSILNFLRDPATALKNVMLELGVKFAKGVEKFWNWITGSDGQSEVVFDAYGNMMIVPKAGEGLTDNGNGQFSLTKDIAGTTVLSPTIDDDSWQKSWDELVGDELDVQARVSLLKNGWTSISEFVGTVVDVFTNLKKNGWSTISAFVGTAVSVATSLTKNGWSSIGGFVGTALSVAISLSKNGWSSIAGYVGTAVSVATSLTKKGWTSIGAFVGTAVTVVATLSAKNKITNVFDTSLTVSASASVKKGKNTTDVFSSKVGVTGELTNADRLRAAATKAMKGIEVTVKAKSGGKGTAKMVTKGRGGAITNGGREIPFARGGVIRGGLARYLEKVPHYAGGTASAHGTVFVAGEAGPEIMGHINGRTEILNRSQLAATMFSAVRAAMGGVKIAATMYDGGGDSGEADYEAMYRAMYDAFTDAMAGSNERDREKVALMRQIAAKEFTTEVTAASVNRAQTRMNRRAGTTIVPVGT